MGFHHDIVHVSLHIPPELIMQAPLHCSLVGGTHVLQPEGHCDVAVGPEWCDEGCFDAVGFIQADLMVS